MSRYFFCVRDGEDRPDESGTELRGLEQARIEAVRLAAGLLEDDPEWFVQGQPWAVDVMDESGATVFSMRLLTDAGPRPSPRPADGDEPIDQGRPDTASVHATR